MDKEIEKNVLDLVAETIWIMENVGGNDWQIIGLKQASGSPYRFDENCIGRNLSEFLDGELLTDRKSLYKKCLDDDAAISFEESFNIVGETNWYLTTIKAIRQENAPLKILGVSQNITARKAAEEKLKKTNRLLEAIATVQARFIQDTDPKSAFDDLLSSLLSLTESEYGFICEVLDGDEGLYLKTRAISNIAWNAETQELYERNAADGLEFRNLNTLFGSVVISGEPVISNDPANDTRRGGLPQGHPPLNSFLGIPFYNGEKMIGMVGVANRPNGYDEKIIKYLKPFLNTCARVMEAYRIDKRKKQIEENLEKSEALLRTIVTNLSLAIYVKDIKGRYQLINKKSEEFYGLSQEQILGKTAFDIFTPSEAERTSKQELEVLREHKIKEYENSFVRNGEVRTRRAIKAPMINANGEVYAICGISMEITEQKRILETLRESESRFRIMADNAPVMIWVAGPDGKTNYYNKGWLDFTGRTLEEELDNGWSKNIHPDDYHRCISTFKDAIAARSPYEIQYRFRRHDGMYRTLLEKGSPRITDGKFAGSIGSCIDITDYLTMEHRLHQAQKMDAIGRLAGGVAHDFNNLLMVILSYTDLLLNIHTHQDDQEYKHLEQIKKATERATSLTRQLLAFSRQQPLQTQEVDLNAAIADLEKMMRRIVREDIELIINLDPTLGPVKAPKGQLEQIILNLVANACDAMPMGGSLFIETDKAYLNEETARLHGSLAPGRFVTLSISDTGTGMDDETISHIFEPFFTTKDLGKGTGLGLAIVHSVITKNGGYLEVNSEVGRGTTFKVYLPQVETVGSQIEIGQEIELYEEGSATILLVEDEDMIRELLNRVLLANGYKVIVAENGARALKLSQSTSEPIHLLLTDVIMPGGINGYELAQKLTDLRPGIKTLCMSGYTDNFILNQSSLEKGFQLMQKPFSPSELVRKVGEILNTN